MKETSTSAFAAWAGQRTLGWVCLGLAAGALSGCGLPIRLDNDVRSFAAWPTGSPSTPATYVFDRLPSQNTPEASVAQTQLEAWTEAALAPKGWQRSMDQRQAQWLVQVTGQANAVKHPSPPPPMLGGYWTSGKRGEKGVYVHAPLMMPPEPAYYQRQFKLVVRAASTGQVVYETQATHDGPWQSSDRIWQALIGASLQGYPAPPAGVQRVVIEVDSK